MALAYDRAARLAVLCVTAPTVAVVVGLLRRRVVGLSAERVQAERDRATARADADSRAFATERNGLERQRDALADTDRHNQRRLGRPDRGRARRGVGGGGRRPGHRAHRVHQSICARPAWV